MDLCGIVLVRVRDVCLRRQEGEGGPEEMGEVREKQPLSAKKDGSTNHFPCL